MERRAVVVVLDGVGAGNAPDAAEFGDEGANTLANTANAAEVVDEGANTLGKRTRAVGGLEVPSRQSRGLANVGEGEGVTPEGSPRASHGVRVEL